MSTTSNMLVSGLFGNAMAIYVIMVVVGVIIVTALVVGAIVIVRRGSNREWPIR